MTTATETVQTSRVYIEAGSEAIRDAIIKPGWTVTHGHAPVVEDDLRPSGGFRAHANEGMLAFGCPEIIGDGDVLEADPPRKLVQTCRMTVTLLESGQQLPLQSGPA